MAIIGTIIKGLIDIRDKIVSEPEGDDAQLEVLKGLLKKAKNTAFGKHYNFEEILESDDIRATYAERISKFRLQ